MTAPVLTPEALCDPDLHAHGDPHELWRWMRAHAPVHHTPAGQLPAFWSLTRYSDVRDVYRDPATFSSARGVLLRPVALGEDPAGGMTLALSDPPRHKHLRSLAADWFTTRSVRGMAPLIDSAIQGTLRQALALGQCDGVHDLAGRLSMYTIGAIMGVPEGDREHLFRWTNEAFEAGISLAGHRELMTYFVDLMARRAAEPEDDLVSMLLHGGDLTEEEVLFNCENIVGATENGRLAVAGGILAFLEHPEQWQRLREDRSLLPAAVEEVLRWTSSATHSMRTTTRAVELHGHRIEAGERVVLWVPSANRDETVFAAPYRFDVGRTPNRHLALGAGEHFCLGSTLARAQLRALFGALLDDGIRLTLAGPVHRVRSVAVGGPEVLPLTVLPR